MTIELPSRRFGSDDAPAPLRRRPPPRYVPSPAATLPDKAPAPTHCSKPSPRARARATHQAETHNPRAARELADAAPPLSWDRQRADLDAPGQGRADGCLDAVVDADLDAGAGRPGATGGAASGPDAADAAASDERALEAGLLALHDQQGIFELLLPGGQALGVVLQSTPTSVQLLLSAGGGMLEQGLRKNKMELERRLQQRMQKDVQIALL